MRNERKQLFRANLGQLCAGKLDTIALLSSHTELIFNYILMAPKTLIDKLLSLQIVCLHILCISTPRVTFCTYEVKPVTL